MTSSELRGKLTEWIAQYSEISGEAIRTDALVRFLATHIESTVFIENDPGILMVFKDGKKQPARVLSEDKARRLINLQLLHDKSYLMTTYDELKKMSSGAEIVAALDAVSPAHSAQPHMPH